jgi:hypothetical protein
VRIDRGVGVGGRPRRLEDAGNQRDDHGDDGCADDDDEDGFDETIVFTLQKANHVRVTTFGMGACGLTIGDERGPAEGELLLQKFLVLCDYRRGDRGIQGSGIRVGGLG